MAEFLEMAALITFVVAVTALLLAFVIRLVAITTPPGMRKDDDDDRVAARSDDGDRAGGAVDHRVAHRTEEHPLEGATAAGSDHGQPRVG